MVVILTSIVLMVVGIPGCIYRDYHIYPPGNKHIPSQVTFEDDVFFSPRWDMLVFWRVYISFVQKITSQRLTFIMWIYIHIYIYICVYKKASSQKTDANHVRIFTTYQLGPRQLITGFLNHLLTVAYLANGP